MRRQNTLIAIACGLVLNFLSCASDTREREVAAVKPPSNDAAISEAYCSGGEAHEDEATLDVPSGKLFGTLRTIEGCQQAPVALIIAGSGPTDRDGNSSPQVRTDAYRWLAQALSDAGIASLRYDKRGVGASAAAVTTEAELRFDDYVDDASAWLSWLAHDGRFARTIVIGHSEGSLIGMLAARQASSSAFISLEGAGRPADFVLREQLHERLSGASLQAADHVLDELHAGRQVDGVDPNDALFRPSIQPYLISWFRYDPADELAHLEIPILIVQGTTDTQVGVADAQLLAAAKSDAQLLVIEGMCHVLKQATSDSADQQRAYTDPSVGLSEPLVRGVIGFVHATGPRSY